MYALDINNVCYDKADCGYEVGCGGHIKQLCIGGRWFDVARYTVAQPLRQVEGATLRDTYTRRLRRLDECYQRPSDAKRAIYDDWCEWAERNGSVVHGVSSYNRMQFSFTALLADGYGDYYALVTVTRDRAYVVPFVSPLIESGALRRA